MAEVAVPAPGRRPSTATAIRAGFTTEQIFFAAALGFAVVGLVLRLYQLDHEPLWLDEGYTLLFSRLPLDRLFVVGGAHEHPPLYYLIVHLVLSLQDSYLVPRVISAVVSSLSILAIYALGARLFGRSAGLVAAGLLTIAPFHVWYARDGRAYELAGLMVLLSYLCLFSALQRPDRRFWIGYALSTALALYSEYTTVFVLLPQFALLLRARREGQIPALLKSWVGVALLFAPWLGVLAANVQGVASDYWIPLPTRDTFVTTVMEMVGFRTPCPGWPCTGPEASLPLVPGHEQLLVELSILIVLGSLVTALLRRDLTVTVLLLWIIVPFAVILLMTARRSLYLDRVFLDATFPIYLLLGGATTTGWVRSRAWRRTRFSPGKLFAVLLTAMIAVASIANLRPIYAESINPDWRTPARDLVSAYQPGQTVIFNPGVLRSLMSAYFPPNWHASRERPLWFHSYLDVPGWQSRYQSVVDRDLHDPRLTPHFRYVRLDGDLRNLFLAEATKDQRQVWLVIPDYSGINDTRHWLLAHGFTLLLSQTYYGDTRIELWDRKGPAEFGPAVLPAGFAGWSRGGSVRVGGGIATENGNAQMSRAFPISAGRAYTVNVEYRAVPPANPTVSLQVYDRSGALIPGFVDRFGQRLDSFPRTEWYAMPANGVWLSQPFGFVAPPGAARAVLRLQGPWGVTSWRHIEVYQEKIVHH